MAFTSPRTYITGEILTAGTLNIDVRDNLRALKGMDGVVQIQDGIQMTGTGTASYFQPPVLTTTQRNAIASPANGMMIYNTTDGKLQKYEATAWRSDLAYGGTLTYLAVPSMAMGDIFYADTGSSITRLGAGTSGFLLTTQGAGTAPIWSVANDIQQYNFADVLVIANDAVATSTLTALGKRKEMRVAQGNLRIKFDLLTTNSGQAGSARIYRNNVAMGTLQTTNSTVFVTFSEDIATWGAGTFCQLYVGHAGSAFGSQVQNFRIYGTSEAMFKVTL